MVIRQIQVKNFRLLKEFTMEMENELSLVIGKNNVGKTSLLVILDKFLNQGDRKGFQYNDFNLDFRCQLKDLIEKEVVDDTKYKEIGIQLRSMMTMMIWNILVQSLWTWMLTIISWDWALITSSLMTCMSI